MRLLYGISSSQIKVWQGWQFQKGKDTYFVLWDGMKLMKSDHGMSIANWMEHADPNLIRSLIKYIFAAIEIKGF